MVLFVELLLYAFYDALLKSLYIVQVLVFTTVSVNCFR